MTIVTRAYRYPGPGFRVNVHAGPDPALARGDHRGGVAARIGATMAPMASVRVRSPLPVLPLAWALVLLLAAVGCRTKETCYRLDTICPRLAEAICHVRQLCLDDAPPELELGCRVAYESACSDSAVPFLDGLLEADGVRYDGSQAAKCVDGLLELSCDDDALDLSRSLDGLGSVCRSVFSGVRAHKKGCVYDEVCEGGTSCRFADLAAHGAGEIEIGGVGRCDKERLLGQSCECPELPCVSSLRCVAGACERREVGPGEPCVDHAQCADDYACVEAVCVKRPASWFRCVGVGDCDDGLYCGDAATAEQVLRVDVEPDDVCKPRLAIGAACGAESETAFEDPCVAGASCACPTGGDACDPIDRLCVVWGDWFGVACAVDGAACIPSGLARCGGDGPTCRPPPALGERCDPRHGASACLGGFCDAAPGETSGTCRALRNLGEGCAADAECAFGDCIVDICRPRSACRGLPWWVEPAAAFVR